MRKVKLGTGKNVMVLLINAADHISGMTGLTPAVSISKNGGAFATITPATTDRGNGWYNLALTALHTDTLGDLVLHVVGTGSDPTDILILVEAGSVDADISTRLAALNYAAPPTSLENATAVRAELAAEMSKINVFINQ